MNEECSELLRLGLSTVRRLALHFGDLLGLVRITRLRQELGRRLKIVHDDQHFRVMIAVEIEQLLEDVTTIKSAGVLKEFSSGDDLENGSGDSIGDAASRVARVCSLAGPEIVLSPPVLVALNEVVCDNRDKSNIIDSPSYFPRIH